MSVFSGIGKFALRNILEHYSLCSEHFTTDSFIDNNRDKDLKRRATPIPYMKPPGSTILGKSPANGKNNTKPQNLNKEITSPASSVYQTPMTERPNGSNNNSIRPRNMSTANSSQAISTETLNNSFATNTGNNTQSTPHSSNITVNSNDFTAAGQTSTPQLPSMPFPNYQMLPVMVFQPCIVCLPANAGTMHHQTNQVNAQGVTPQQIPLGLYCTMPSPMNAISQTIPQVPKKETHTNRKYFADRRRKMGLLLRYKRREKNRNYNNQLIKSRKIGDNASDVVESSENVNNDENESEHNSTDVESIKSTNQGDGQLGKI